MFSFLLLCGCVGLVSKQPLPTKDLALRAVAYCCWSLNRALEIVDAGGFVLSGRDANQASNCLLQHLRSYQYLASKRGIADAKLFKLRPKCHYLWHTAMQTKQWRINPNIFHCFSEESYLGRCKRIAVQCHGGTMTHRVIQRYLICLALYLEGHRRQTQRLTKSA